MRGYLQMNFKTLNTKQHKPIDIFFYAVPVGTFLSMLGTILYYAYAFAAKSVGSDDFDWLLGIFSDFVYIMQVSLGDSPYTVADSSYPPLAIAVLYPFALICRGVFEKYEAQSLSLDELTSRVLLHAEFWISLLLFFAICSTAIIFLFSKLYKPTPAQSFKLSIIVLCCAPFVFAATRGNTIYFALIFLLAFLWLYQSENALLREIAYLCLALSGLIKIYPLFFGVLLLAKKKIFAAFRVALYTFVLFFASFFLFDGGAAHIVPFVQNLCGFAANEQRLYMCNNLSLSHLLYRLSAPLSPSESTFGIINFTVLSLALVLSAICAMLATAELSRLLISACAVVLIPPVSYFYVLIFMTLPFALFIFEYNTLPVFKQRLYTALFLVILSTPLMLPRSFILQSLSVIILLMTECTNTALSSLKRTQTPFREKTR